MSKIFCEKHTDETLRNLRGPFGLYTKLRGSDLRGFLAGSQKFQLQLPTMKFTCALKLLFKFVLSDILPKFSENTNEVFNSYKSVRVFVKFAKNHPHVDVPLASCSHFGTMTRSNTVTSMQTLPTWHIQGRLVFIWFKQLGGYRFACKRGFVLLTRPTLSWN